eukprot:1139344-Pelagomonas_calceolata.AAC.1
MEESTEGVSGEEARPYKEGEIALKEGYPGLRCRRVGETSGDVCWDACWLPAAAALACRSARSCRRRAATSCGTQWFGGRHTLKQALKVELMEAGGGRCLLAACRCS